MLNTLEDVNVLDFGLYFAGPYASRLLADLGAKVIKLEPLEGDTLRPTTKPFNGAQRGKRSIAVDLKVPQGKEVAHRLVRGADVVTHNLRPGVAERLAMDYETVRQLNQEVVYAYAPGWGSSGPDAQLPGFAPLFSGYAGLHYEAAGLGNPPSAPVGNEDNGNGLVGATAILMALYHRRRSGKGQYLEHPQLNATLLMAAHLMRTADDLVVGSTNLDGQRMGGHPLDRIYATADGWLCVSARTDPEFARLTQIPAFAHLLVDERWSTAPRRQVDGDELATALAEVFELDVTANWLAVLRQARVPCEIPAGTAARHQLFHDPEERRIGRVEEYQHPTWGTVRDIAVLVRLSGATSRRGRPAPEIGQHTHEILSELGYSAEEREELRIDKVVR